MSSDTFSREDMERANKLLCWMAGYVGQMAPGAYGDAYADLNEHFIAMGQADINCDDPSKIERKTHG